MSITYAYFFTGKLVSKAVIAEVLDKRSGAVLVINVETSDAEGR